jgi:hypothetical protein
LKGGSLNALSKNIHNYEHLSTLFIDPRLMDEASQNPPSNLGAGYGTFLITSKVLDARRRGATTEAYGGIRRKEERSKATPPFGFTQGHEPVEWQMMP